ncbi:hypothetical protein M2427_006684 [Bradyrhizobium sp. BR13661]|nr:hypothetical protein [Bradyrhizobium sp. BR13661]
MADAIAIIAFGPEADQHHYPKRSLHGAFRIVDI